VSNGREAPDGPDRPGPDPARPAGLRGPPNGVNAMPRTDTPQGYARIALHGPSARCYPP
jgi:hypothetical protein